MSPGDGFRRFTDAARTHGYTVIDRGSTTAAVQCPVHGDTRPSLSVTCGPTSALLKCHAQQCPPADIVAALGLSLADLFDDTGTGRTPSEDWMPCTAPDRGGHHKIEEYLYRDEFGKTLYGVARCDRKCFAQWHPATDSKSGRRWSMEGIRRVPYLLPELLAGLTQGDTAWIVEGERDVHAVMERHRTVTCNSGGAGKWHPDFATHFHDADIVIVADRDKPGHEHAAAVAQTLLPVANSIIIIRSAHGKDARDHFAGGGHLGNFVPVAEPKKWVGPNNVTAQLLTDFTR